MHKERFRKILDSALEGWAPGREDCLYLLSFTPESLQSAIICAVADTISRKRFKNRAVLLGQIGVEAAPCPGKCKFCSFGQGHTKIESSSLEQNELRNHTYELTAGGDLFALFLMGMHDINIDRLLETIDTVRSVMPAKTRLVVNIGDFTLAQARILREAGVDGAYHVLRLREGIDTALDPEQRKATIKNITDAGLDWYYCCEPIGPEHTDVELVDQIFLGVELGCFQHAAMRRVYLPNSPLAHYGQITERRLAQVVAVVTLASLASPNTKSIAVHEPNMLGLIAGANSVYAEAGSNPRDNERETSKNRGRNTTDCKRMFFETGFSNLLLGDGSTVSLTCV